MIRMSQVGVGSSFLDEKNATVFVFVVAYKISRLIRRVIEKSGGLTKNIIRFLYFSLDILAF